MLHQVMAILHYGCLKLKTLGLWGVIVVGPSTTNTYLYKQEGTALAAADFARIWR